MKVATTWTTQMRNPSKTNPITREFTIIGASRLHHEGKSLTLFLFDLNITKFLREGFQTIWLFTLPIGQVYLPTYKNRRKLALRFVHQNSNHTEPVKVREEDIRQQKWKELVIPMMRGSGTSRVATLASFSRSTITVRVVCDREMSYESIG